MPLLKSDIIKLGCILLVYVYTTSARGVVLFYVHTRLSVCCVASAAFPLSMLHFFSFSVRRARALCKSVYRRRPRYGETLCLPASDIIKYTHFVLMKRADSPRSLFVLSAFLHKVAYLSVCSVRVRLNNVMLRISVGFVANVKIVSVLISHQCSVVEIYFHLFAVYTCALTISRDPFTNFQYCSIEIRTDYWPR